MTTRARCRLTNGVSHSANGEIPRALKGKTVIIWDNDGTVLGSKNPNDTTSRSKIILPNVERVMNDTPALHIICSGGKTAEGEVQNFDPLLLIERFTALMKQLPLTAAAFSPAIGGTQCYLMIKDSDASGAKATITVQEMHDEPRYQHLIGQFKKPDIGMFIVIADLLQEKFGITMNADTTLMIGDAWQDEQAATAAGIPFLAAESIHNL